MLPAILTLLGPILAAWLQGCQKTDPTVPSDPKEALLEHYDATSDTWDESTVRKARPRTRRAELRAAREEGIRRRDRDRLTPEQLDEITRAKFEEIRLTDDAEVASAFASMAPSAESGA